MLTLGIDEVGRGPWAGPLVVGAVVLDSADVPSGLKDSKQTTKKFREREIVAIQVRARAIGLGWVSAPQLDRVGMTRALHLAAAEALRQVLEYALPDQIDQIVIDGTGNFLDDFPDPTIRHQLRDKILVMPKADAKIATASAASIVAKVFRDNYMTQLANIFPEYDFSHNVGYGVKKHAAAIRKFGVIPGVHRASFRPIREFLGDTIETRGDWQDSKKLNSTIGRRAETVAADFLITHGHDVIERNYKTRFYEIDIISQKGNCLYFTEVKYRSNPKTGDGVAAITPQKLTRMKRAATDFLANFHKLTDDFDVKISAISLSNNPPTVEEFIENVAA